MALSHRIVVMNKGVIEQVGTPEEIYDNPATKYVASFIGEMNFIEENGGKVLAVRPEDIILTKGDSGDMVGSVRSIMMLGHYAEIIVQMGNQTVKSYLNRALAGGFRVQDRVSLSFNRVCEYSA